MTSRLISAVTIVPSTHRAPHVRDAMSATLLHGALLVALLPSLLFGLYNAGRHANQAIATLELGTAPGWRGRVIEAVGSGVDPTSVIANAWHGLLIFAPLFIGALFAAELWRRVFRRDGFDEILASLTIALLVALTVPPATAAWQVAVGVSFGVVVGKEIFGGTGKNFLHPALTGIAFLYLTYPNVIRGPEVWTAVAGSSAQPPMALITSGGIEALRQSGLTWWDAFVGNVPGGIGATSTLAAIVGGALLLHTRLISWRILLGAVGGLAAAASLFGQFGVAATPAASLPWYWHLNVAGFAFMLVFVATDPVTSACTNSGRWLYGVIIGVMTALIRVANPSQTEAVILAILLGNITAPVIDYGIMQINARRRRQRCG